MLGAILGEYVAGLYSQGLAGELEDLLRGKDVMLPDMYLTECIRINAGLVEALQDASADTPDEKLEEGIRKSLLAWHIAYKDFWPEGIVPTSPSDPEFLLLPALFSSSIGWLYPTMEKVLKNERSIF